MKTIASVVLSLTFAGLVSAQEPPPAKRDVEKDAAEFSKALVDSLRIVEQSYVKPTSKAELAKWAVEGLFAAVKEPMPKAIRVAVEELPQADRAALVATFRDARRSLGDRKELADGDDLVAAMKAVFGKLAPIDPEWAVTPASKVVIPPLPPDRNGVGLKFEPDAKSGYLRVVTPIHKSPAYEAGIRAGDLIVAIRQHVDEDGKPLPKTIEHSTKGMTRERAVKLILGPPRTTVTLVAFPAGTEARAK